MTENRLLRRLAAPARSASFALAGLLALAACGGGSGAPNNPYAPRPTVPGPLTVLPPDRDRLLGRADDADDHRRRRAVLRVLEQFGGPAGDAGGRGQHGPAARRQRRRRTRRSSITVQDMPEPRPPPTVTVTPGAAAAQPHHDHCPTATAGGTTASARAAPARRRSSSPAPAAAASRAGQVRFDVVSGAYAIQTTNPAQPLVSTLTVVTDAERQRVGRHRRQRQRADADRHHPRDRRHVRQPGHRQLH